MLKRLTVHLTKVKKTRKEISESKKGNPTNKTFLTNTISVHNLKSEAEITSALSKIRNTHRIAKCKKPDHKIWKVGEEMWYTSNESI